jgi:EAL domain-containing protein (putative c-di-GMP-specific phosphodiesterase class I)
MRARAVQRLELERSLHHSVEEHALLLHYQPTVDLADGRVTGVEALVRWQHPTLGLLRPDLFIPIAEDSELIVTVGTWVLNEACRQAAAWRRSIPGLEDFVMWVNVSGAQLSRMDVPAAVAAALDATGLEASGLGLEITETVFIDQTESMYATFAELRALGVMVAIDDFGTGFSSLGSLKRFRADVLKIDGSFVKGIEDDEEDIAIVAACIALAETLGLSTIAEAVETSGQRARLIAMGCEHAQGFLFCRPVPAEDAEAYLRGVRPMRRVTPIELPHAAGRPPLALVCDDEPSARGLYAAALESEGAEVKAVADAAACIDWAVKHRPDLALVDLRMPGRDGLSTINELRRRCPETRLVLMTADADSDRFRHGLDHGADACISKDALLARLGGLLAEAAPERPSGAA